MPTYKDYPLTGIDYEYEQYESLLVTSLLRHGMHCIDLGANSGHFTLLMALYTGATGKVLSVEPDPVTMSRCRQNVWANGLRTVELLCCAVARDNSVRRLFLDTGGGGDNRMTQYEGEDRSSVLVPALSLDTMAGLLPGGRVDFVKLDIQGAECEAVIGGARALSANPDAGMLVEYSPYDLTRGGGSGPLLIALIQRLGFQILVLDDPYRRLLFLPAGRTLRDERLGERGVVNLLCLRGKFNDPSSPWWKSQAVMPIAPSETVPVPGGLV